MSDALARGRECFSNRDWSQAYDQLQAADAESPLVPEDVERLAVAAYLTGHDSESAHAWSRGHQESLSLSDPERAVRCARLAPDR